MGSATGERNPWIGIPKEAPEKIALGCGSNEKQIKTGFYGKKQICRLKQTRIQHNLHRSSDSILF